MRLARKSEGEKVAGPIKKDQAPDVLMAACKRLRFPSGASRIRYLTLPESATNKTLRIGPPTLSDPGGNPRPGAAPLLRLKGHEVPLADYGRASRHNVRGRSLQASPIARWWNVSLLKLG